MPPVMSSKPGGTRAARRKDETGVRGPEWLTITAQTYHLLLTRCWTRTGAALMSCPGSQHNPQFSTRHQHRLLKPRGRATNPVASPVAVTASILRSTFNTAITKKENTSWHYRMWGIWHLPFPCATNKGRPRPLNNTRATMWFCGGIRKLTHLAEPSKETGSVIESKTLQPRMPSSWVPLSTHRTKTAPFRRSSTSPMICYLIPIRLQVPPMA